MIADGMWRGVVRREAIIITMGVLRVDIYMLAIEDFCHGRCHDGRKVDEMRKELWREGS
jgi:hypothetical protein